MFIGLLTTQPHADTREWSHSLLEAINIINTGDYILSFSVRDYNDVYFMSAPPSTAGDSRKRRGDDSSDDSAQIREIGHRTTSRDG